MFKDLIRIGIVVAVVQVSLLSIFSNSEAKNLKDVLGRGLDIQAIPVGRIPVGSRVLPAFAGAVAQAVAQQIPFAAVAPAFAYHYNPAVDTFERSTNVPGPLFSERALTLGEGQLNFSVGYAFVDFTELNGASLDEVRSPALLFETFRDPVVTPSGLAGFRLSAVRIHTQLDLQAQVIAPSLRYGITENWDIGLTIPIVHTFVRVRNETERVADLNGLL